jgi:hypothetical protein
MRSVLEIWEAIQAGEISAPQKASDFVELARKLMRVGHSSEAAQAFSKAFEMDPGCPEACFGLASLLVKAGKGEAAVELRTLGLDLSRARYPLDASLPNGTETSPSNVWVATGKTADSQNFVAQISAQLAADILGNWTLTHLNSPNVQPKTWNAVLERCAHDSVEWVVFGAAKLEVQLAGLLPSLREARREYGADIVGVAGGSQLAVASPTTWGSMCLRASLLGQVAFRSLSGEVVPHVFGPTTGVVDVLDDILLAVHVPSAVAAGWRFNESFPSYHCVMASCLDARFLGLRLAVAPLKIIQSTEPEIEPTQEHWQTSEDRFLSRYVTPQPGTAPPSTP